MAPYKVGDNDVKLYGWFEIIIDGYFAHVYVASVTFNERQIWFEDIGFGIDTRNIFMAQEYVEKMCGAVDGALAAMEQLEGGAMANDSERRMVGHYWLRAPHLAPTVELRKDIEKTKKNVQIFAADVLNGKYAADSGPFTDLLCVGIGGSALGTQLLLGALADASAPLRAHFLDNTDPEGFLREFATLENHWERTLIIVTSKSGSTPEPNNALRAVEWLLRTKNLALAERAVAVTCTGSILDKRARDESWLQRFPMWDWVGGRTSVTSAVGLLPAALSGIDIDQFLGGAATMDRLTRAKTRNPAVQLALSWHFATHGIGAHAMVILPYADRLQNLSRYLQQLVMESLGKRHDRLGRVVCQGLTVYGNRGSTDQHSYVQQLRDGLCNFFVTFIEVLRHGDIQRDGSLRTAAEYLEGFFLGTREALAAENRQSLTITLRQVDAFSLGMLVALYERAVGLYAEFIGVNAYDQPGVEAGKKAADRALQLLREVEKFLKKIGKKAAEVDAETVAQEIGQNNAVENVRKWLDFLRMNA
ncbi:MAG: glucose-6-phosphate isomerase [Puniceicoccales bacterium]|jgi:glucose-6-phosphate isomerase|nr:glucose-6-phosphate isomerase [Puniceicoccales bacterium]